MGNGPTDTREEEEGGMNWEIGSDVYTLRCVEWLASGSCCTAQGAQLGAR